MSSTPQLLINKFFKIYCKFFHIDIETAILEGRSFDIIDLFRINIGLLIDKNAKAKNVLKSLSALDELVDEELETFRIVKIYECNNIGTYSIKGNFEQIKEYITTFIQAYEFTFDALELDSKDRKIQDLLVEFNNALSHVLSSLFQNKQESIVNIEKSKTHLYRGILDAYKEVIHKHSNIVRADARLHAKLDEKTFLNYYVDIRVFEANSIGKYENGKEKLLKMYKSLAWELVN